MSEIIRTTSKYTILVELSNLTFEQEHGPSRDSNVKFAPLEAEDRIKRKRDGQAEGEVEDDDSDGEAEAGVEGPSGNQDNCSAA